MLKLIASLLLIGAPATAWAQHAPELPPRAVAASIGEEIRVNGVAMRATHFKSPAAAQDVLAFYRESWVTADPADRPREASLGGWRVLGRQTASRHETVQVRALPDGGSEGYIASSETRARPRAPARSPLSLPFGAKTVSVVESNDGTRHSTQILARSPFGTSMTERWLRTSARLRGFESELDTEVSETLFLKRGGEELISVVQPEGSGSVVIIHHVSAP